MNNSDTIYLENLIIHYHVAIRQMLKMSKCASGIWLQACYCTDPFHHEQQNHINQVKLLSLDRTVDP